MRKKFLSAFMLGLLALGTTSTITSCKDYDDDLAAIKKDIKSLEDLIAQKESTINSSISALQSAIDKANADHATKAALEEAKNTLAAALASETSDRIAKDAELSAAIAKAQGAADAAANLATENKEAIQKLASDLATTNANLGTLSEKLAEAETEIGKLQAGLAAQIEACDKANADLKKDLDELKAYVDAQDEALKDALKSEINAVAEQVANNYEELKSLHAQNAADIAQNAADIQDILTNKIPALEEKWGEELAALKAVFSQDLRSLVFVPRLYLDGIEAIEYPWVNDTILHQHLNLQTTSRLENNTHTAGKKITGIDDYLPNVLLNEPQSDEKPIAVYNWGKKVPVQYHANPSNANVKAEDVQGFNLLNPQVIYFNTRAAQGVTVNKVDELFAAPGADGIMTVGLQFENPQLINYRPTDNTENPNDYTVALQVNNSFGKTITSDYALIQPEKAFIDGLVWAKKPQYVLAGKNNNILGDEASKACPNQKVHVWDSPQEALKYQYGAALEVFYDDEVGVKIEDYLAIHMVKSNVNRTQSLFTVTPAEAAEWGLSFEYNLVNYKVDGNETVDSKYAKWVDQSKGQVRAWNVKYDENPQQETSKAAVDREPLVQVIVKNTNGDVVLDGYILLHITTTPPTEPDNTEVTLWDATDKDWTACDGTLKVLETKWAEFSDYILTQTMENMPKNVFDAQYAADVYGNPFTGKAGNQAWYMNQYASFVKNGGSTQNVKKIGEVTYHEDIYGTTNHTFVWEISEEELEALTHDQTTPVTVTTYVRYKAISPDAKYPFIYIKFTTNITRKGVAAGVFAEKNTNYWYGLDGSDEGLDAIVFDVVNPYNGGNIKAINRTVNSTLVKNQPTVAGRYYFVPKNVDIQTQSGTYTITCQESASDSDWDKLICYWNGTNKHPYADFEAVYNKCAIDANKGVFACSEDNGVKYQTLYAKQGIVYTPIATLNVMNSEIKLIHNTVCEDILNAVGYAKNHANINEEFRTYVGYLETYCDGIYAKYVNDGTFLTSWQRPINFEDIADQSAEDAQTNGNILYAVDFLKLYDWRGPEVGYMWGDNQWFWAYYNVNSISIDCRPSSVYTNMHGKDINTTKLSEVSSDVQLCTYPSMAQQYTWNFDLTKYDSEGMNGLLLARMGIVPSIGAIKAQLGAIYYTNNGDNVSEFDVRIPVTIGYEWGTFTKYVKVHIKRTSGN